MPVVVDYADHHSNQGAADVECNLQLCAARGKGEILLSKTSLGHECGEPSPLVDLYGICVSDACDRPGVSASFIGEPATPNGAGDFVISYSPVSNLPTGQGYFYGQASMILHPENSSENGNLARRSCGFESDGPSPYSGYSAPVPALRHNRFLSEVAYGGPGVLSTLSSTAVLGTSEPVLPTSTECHAARLEQELLEQCAENQRLRQQMRDKDEQLYALRAEVKRLQAERGRAHTPPDAIQEEEASGLLLQLQRAREKLDQQGNKVALSGLRKDIVVVTHCTAGDDESVTITTAEEGKERHLQGSSWLRLHTPPRVHMHEALTFVRTLSDGMQGPRSATTSGLCHAEPQQQLANNEGKPLVEIAPEPCSIAGAPDAEAASGTKATAVKLPVEHSVKAPVSSHALGPLLVEERRRTDRVHAALLFSSRQAARLAEQLTEAQVRAAALREELRDWRRACLDNHRELSRHRKATAADGIRM